MSDKMPKWVADESGPPRKLAEVKAELIGENKLLSEVKAENEQLHADLLELRIANDKYAAVLERQCDEVQAELERVKGDVVSMRDKVLLERQRAEAAESLLSETQEKLREAEKERDETSQYNASLAEAIALLRDIPEIPYSDEMVSSGAISDPLHCLEFLKAEIPRLIFAMRDRCAEVAQSFLSKRRRPFKLIVEVIQELKP